MSREDIKARPAIVSSAGALISLALHILFITPVLIGFGTSAQRPRILPSESESLAEENASSSMTLTLIDEPESGAEGLEKERSARLSASPPLSSFPVPAPLPRLNFPGSDDAGTDHNNPITSNQLDPGLQILFGRYMGQITARIERAWTRPRTPIDAPFFACRVRITQDRSGAVQEIELVRCNGNPRWQASLVHAIQSASPLPAPPDAGVFTPRVTLDLQSATFTLRDPADGFEPETQGR